MIEGLLVLISMVGSTLAELVFALAGAGLVYWAVVMQIINSLGLWEWVGYSAIGCVITFLCYIVIMRYKNKRDQEGGLSTTEKIVVAPFLFVGGILDIFLVNFIIGTVIYRELPQEWTFSARAKRHKHDDGWRGRLSAWVADLLNPYDKGHI